MRAVKLGLGMLIGGYLLPIGAHTQPIPYELAAPYERPTYANALARAKRGNAEAQYWVGMYLATTTSSDQAKPINKAAALRWLSLSVAQGYPPAQVPFEYLKREEAEFQTIRSAALTGDAESQYAFGTYLLVRGPEANWETGDKPRIWVTRAANQGEFKAMWLLGRMELNDWAGKGRRDSSLLASAIEWLEKSALQGHQGAIYDLTVLYAPDGVAADPERMEHWLIGTRPDARPVPYLSFNGFGSHRNSEATPCVYFEGVELRRRIDLQTGSLESRARREPDFKLGRICRQNEGLRWEAAYKLAYYFHYGLGGPTDLEKAQALYLALLLKDGQLQPYWDEAALRLALLLDARGRSAEAYKWLRVEKYYEHWRKQPEDGRSPEKDMTAPPPDAVARIQLASLANALMNRLESTLPADVRAEQEKAAAELLANRYIPPPVF